MHINVLDHGFVSLIDHMGTDLSVVNAARISMGKRKEKFDEADATLIQYLAENEHTSPFRHTCMTLHFKAPIFVARQSDKHQVGVSVNSLSGRYAEMKDEFYVPFNFRRQAKINKQGSAEDLEPIFNQIATDIYIDSYNSSMKAYRELLQSEVCREQARCVLPQALYTEWYMTMSLQAAAHFIHLRTDEHAQWEMQQYGLAVDQIVQKLFPNSLKALLLESSNA